MSVLSSRVTVNVKKKHTTKEPIKLSWRVTPNGVVVKHKKTFDRERSMNKLKENTCYLFHTFRPGDIIRKVTLSGEFIIFDDDALYEIGILNRLPPYAKNSFDYVLMEGANIQTLLKQSVFEYHVTKICSIGIRALKDCGDVGKLSIRCDNYEA